MPIQTAYLFRGTGGCIFRVTREEFVLPPEWHNDLLSTTVSRASGLQKPKTEMINGRALGST